MIQTTARFNKDEYEYLKSKEIGLNKYLRKLVRFDMECNVLVKYKPDPVAAISILPPLKKPPKVKSDKLTVAKKRLNEVTKEEPNWKKNTPKNKEESLDDVEF